jgi:hypothetical protein
VQVKNVQIDEVIDVFDFGDAIHAEHEHAQTNEIFQARNTLDLIVVQVEKDQISHLIQILYVLYLIVLVVDKL